MTASPLRDFHHDSLHGQIGIGRVDITPPVGIFARNWGAAKHDVVDSIHRPLTLTALTLATASGESPMVLLDADLGWWKPSQAFSRMQTGLQEAFSLTPEKLIFALSHTHSAPPLMEPDESLPGNEIHQVWMESLYESAIRVVKEALSSTIEATLDWHHGRCSLAAVRDVPDPNPEKQRVLCGYNPETVADDTLIFGRITDTKGQIRGTLVNYACHPTTLAWENTSISPDYIGAMRETIQATTGVPALFLLGACGDLAPRYQYVGEHAVPDRHGRQLGFAALATLNDMEPSGTRLAYAGIVESGAPLAIWKHKSRVISRVLRARQVMVELPLKNWPTTDELEQQRIACTDRALQERIRRKRDIRRVLGDGSTFLLPVQVWRIGDAVLVGCCGEPYSLLQKELRSRFSGRTILCMNLINGSLGYLPPAELYDTDTYAVWQTPFDRGCFEKTLAAMTQAIHDILTD